MTRIGLLLLLVTACSESPDAGGVVCDADADCAPGRSCRAGLCQVVCEGGSCPCSSDAGCAAGQLCDRAAGQCFATECGSDSDCSPDRGHRPGLICERGACGVDISIDTDSDGIPDGSDNCWTQSNAGQADLDGDGAGDICDPDRDGDGLRDEEDNCPDRPNDDQTDRNKNGVGDACEQERGTLVVTVDVQPDWIPPDQRYVRVRIVGAGFRDTNERVGDSGDAQGSTPRPASFGPLPAGRYNVIVERPGFESGSEIEVELGDDDDVQHVSVTARLSDLGASSLQMSGVEVTAPDGLDGVSLRTADLSGATLDGLDLSGRDLTGARLSTTSLRNASLDCAQLSHTSFFGADLRGATLRRVTAAMARFDNANLREAVLDDVDADTDCPAPEDAFEAATFAYADLESASLRDLTLQVTQGRPPEFSFARMRAVDLSGARLARVGFLVADLTNAVLDGADLSGARLTSAILEDASARGAVFDGATLTGALLRHTDLRCAGQTCTSMRGADLTAVAMIGARLDGADLSDITALGLTVGHSTALPTEQPELCQLPQGCTWAERSQCGAELDEECRIRRTSLNRTHLDRALLNGVIFDRVLLGQTSFVDARLRGSAFSEASFAFTDFTGAQMAGAMFAGQVVALAEFAGADLTGADFTAASLESVSFSDCGWTAPEYDCRDRDFRGEGDAWLCTGQAPNPQGYCVAADVASCLGVCRPAQLRAAVFSAASLRDVNMRGTDLTATSFRLADLDGAQLDGVLVDGADLSGANLTCVSLEAATIRDSDLSRTDLTATDLDGTLIEDTTFAEATGGAGLHLRGNIWSGVPGPWVRGATLRNTNWERTYFEGVHFDGADMSYTTTTTSRWNWAVLTNTDWRRGDFRGEMWRACFQNAQLEGSFSRGAFVRDSDFPGTRFVSVDLGEVRIDGTSSLESADMSGACAYHEAVFGVGLICPDGTENQEGEVCGLPRPPDCL